MPIETNEIIDGEINFDKANSTNFEDYLRVDVSAHYDFELALTAKDKIGVSVWNVWDKTNIIDNRYRINDGTVTPIEQSPLGSTTKVVLRLFF